MNLFTLMFGLTGAAIVILVAMDLRRTRGRPPAMRTLRAVVIALVVYIAGGAITEFKLTFFPLVGTTFATLRTFDTNGQSRDTVVGPIREPNGRVWLVPGHWPSLRPGGWYDRVLANPDIELIANGQVVPMRAIPRPDPEAVETVTRMLGKGRRGYVIFRTVLLWPPIRPLQLMPRPVAMSLD